MDICKKPYEVMKYCPKHEKGRQERVLKRTHILLVHTHTNPVIIVDFKYETARHFRSFRVDISGARFRRRQRLMKLIK